MKRYTFPKEERLCSKRLIDDLFRSGSSFFIYPYRVTYQRIEGIDTPVQVLLSASRRRFRRAVTRNLLKRRMREAYRLQKADLLLPSVAGRGFGLIISIQYVGRDVLGFDVIHNGMRSVLERLREEIVR